MNASEEFKVGTTVDLSLESFQDEDYDYDEDSGTTSLSSSYDGYKFQCPICSSTGLLESFEADVKCSYCKATFEPLEDSKYIIKKLGKFL